ncbi:30S ribosomal protein S4e [Candidatus Woesearchaeota archaeon]|nr:30S ribosomal protein S4e [Candidatus Woesearchaeota archaeon]
MGKKHMKTQTAPVTWKIKRKSSKFVVRPNPGKSFRLSMPLSLIFKNLLKYCKTTKEVKSILQDKKVIVDGSRRKDYKYPVGLMDVISLPVSDKHFRLFLDKNGNITVIEIKKKEAKLKPCKITNKSVLKQAKIQLNFSDGRNLILKKDDYNVGDTLLIELPGQKIKDHFKLKKGNYTYLTGGKNAGSHGIINKIEDDILVVESPVKKKIRTDKKYSFILGKKKSSIELPKLK